MDPVVVPVGTPPNNFTSQTFAKIPKSTPSMPTTSGGSPQQHGIEQNNNNNNNNNNVTKNSGGNTVVVVVIPAGGGGTTTTSGSAGNGGGSPPSSTTAPVRRTKLSTLLRDKLVALYAGDADENGGIGHNTNNNNNTIGKTKRGVGFVSPTCVTASEFQYKLDIMLKNPAVFQLFQQKMKDAKQLSNMGVSLALLDFVQNELKACEVGTEIKKHQYRNAATTLDLPPLSSSFQSSSSSSMSYQQQSGGELRLGNGRLLSYLKDSYLSTSSSIQATGGKVASFLPTPTSFGVARANNASVAGPACGGTPHKKLAALDEEAENPASPSNTTFTTLPTTMDDDDTSSIESTSMHGSPMDEYGPTGLTNSTGMDNEGENMPAVEHGAKSNGNNQNLDADENDQDRDDGGSSSIQSGSMTSLERSGGGTHNCPGHDEASVESVPLE